MGEWAGLPYPCAAATARGRPPPGRARRPASTPAHHSARLLLDPQVGPRALAAWIRHALALAACALARLLTLPLRRLAFRAARLAPGGRGTGVLAWLRRALDALAAGAGHDGAGGGVRIVDAPPSEGAAA